MQHIFFNISLPLCDYGGKNARFHALWRRKTSAETAKFSFSSFSELGYGSSEFSSNRVRLFLRSNFVKIIAIKIERTRIHFESDVFALDLMVPNNALLEVLRVT